MKRQRVNFPSKLLIYLLILAVAAVFIPGYIRRLLITSDYFRVKEVTSIGGVEADFPYLKGKNIFLLDLPYESAYIAKFCPDCLRVRLARVLPDKVFVRFIKRKTLALVELYRYFAVDENAVLYDTALTPNDAGVPLITGLKSKLPQVKTGREYKIKELALSLDIIQEMSKFVNLKGYPIRRIDIAGLDDITIFMIVDSGTSLYSNWQMPQKQKILEVRISQGNIIEKIAVMSGLINQEKDSLGNINYIDLRFKEPVIKFKDVK